MKYSLIEIDSFTYNINKSKWKCFFFGTDYDVIVWLTKYLIMCSIRVAHNAVWKDGSTLELD